jgi:hypothetical protein
MIRIQAIGGLGNQLFIWNLAHHLEDKYNSRIVIHFPATKSDRKCEIRRLETYCKHRIEIVENDSFNGYMSLLDRIQTRNPTISKLVNKLFGIYKTDLPSEPFEGHSKRPRIVRGYFQSPDLVSRNLHLYFDELNELTSSLREASELSLILTSEVVVLHIRRGDFLVNAEKVGLLKLDYFKSQVEPNTTPVIFTDADESDLEVTTYFKDAVIFGEHLVDTWTSFALMSFAQNLVLSNSTFSWWAGFLARARGGEVKAPSPWTRTPIYGKNYLHLDGFTHKPAFFLGDYK